MLSQGEDASDHGSNGQRLHLAHTTFRGTVTVHDPDTLSTRGGENVAYAHRFPPYSGLSS